MSLQSQSPSPSRCLLNSRPIHLPLRRTCPIRFRAGLPSPQQRRTVRIVGIENSALFRLSRKLKIASCASETYKCMEPSDPLDSVSKGSLSNARAYWVCKSHIAWDIRKNNSSIYLYASEMSKLHIMNDDIAGFDTRIKLEQDFCGLPAIVKNKFPHIKDYTAYIIPNDTDVAKLLKHQLAVVCFDEYGKYVGATGLQLPGILDDLFSYNGPLGAVFGKEAISLHLWAPTAQVVRAYLFDNEFIQDPSECIDLEEKSGVWHASLPSDREGCYYVYEVSAYHQCTLNIESCMVNDPYARGISSDGRRTLLVNIDSSRFMPPGWSDLSNEKPELRTFSDISIYELHIRDFSAMDYTVNPEHRGGYLAFTCQRSSGVEHLRMLSNAGLTHVHLLPSFHFAGVDDNKDKWKHVDEKKLSMLSPDSDEQQAEITAVQDQDAYNWGYNPVLWSVPKGSYASNPSGALRVLEFRKMVQALNQIGLRVVLDVVYNHVSASGPHDEFSVLEKIVPGYYLRRNADGYIEHSTCINNTASEHFMMERLIIDDLLSWAVDYKVDGFRFDLMGHIMKNTMVKAKSALQNLSISKDGIDGSKIYIYGEGWDFGEVAKNARGINSSQFNVSGTGIGSFNDRIRDSVLGGSPFGHPLQQGFVTGLSLSPNDHDHGDIAATEAMLASSLDHILAGLSGNLKDFVFTSHLGNAVKGSEVLTHDQMPVSYASCPTETINYVSAHDNETLFDIISLKTPETISLGERCRINHLATSLIALSQGIPFFHAGDEILRSKSLDRDSYNSGDWFNKLDYTYESNNWGVGLPPKEKNEKNWPLIKRRLGNPAFKPGKEHILAAVENFKDLLKIRYSSPLFRLKTANAIQERLRFHNTGPSWIPGVIVMSIEDGHSGCPGMSQLDPNYSFIVVVFNARPSLVSFSIPSLGERKLQLHPVQLASGDRLTKTSSYGTSPGLFVIPQHTTAVFVEVRDL